MRYVKALLLIAFFFISMLFFVQNTADLSRTVAIKLNVMSWNYTSAELPIYLMILASFAIGAIVACLYFIADKVRCTAALRDERKRCASLQAELARLQNPVVVRPVETPAAPAATQAQ